MGSILSDASRTAVERDWQPEAKTADVEAAHALDIAQRDGRDRLQSSRAVTRKATVRKRGRVTSNTYTTASAPDLLRYCRTAVGRAAPMLTREQQEDATSELVMAVARRDGWTPPRRRLQGYWLTMQARAVCRDYVARLRHEAADGADLAEEDADTGASVLATSHASIAPVAALDADADLTADALALNRDGAAVVAAALSGYGSAVELAAGLGIGHDAARQRLSRGRAAIRAQYPDPDALVEALAGALADADDGAPVAADAKARPHCPMAGADVWRGGRVVKRGTAGVGSMWAALRPTNAAPVDGRSRVALSAEQRTARSLLEAVGDTTPAPRPSAGWKLAPEVWASGSVERTEEGATVVRERSHDAPTAVERFRDGVTTGAAWCVLRWIDYAETRAPRQSDDAPRTAPRSKRAPLSPVDAPRPTVRPFPCGVIGTQYGRHTRRPYVTAQRTGRPADVLASIALLEAAAERQR